SCEPSETWKTVGSKSCVATREHLLEILVAAPAEAYEHVCLVALTSPRQGVSRFERRDDPFGPRQRAERLERLPVGRADILRAPAVPQRGVLGPDTGVV